MKIVCIKGGLGNQLFEYSCAQCLERVGKKVCYYYDRRRLKQHNGVELHRCFHINLPKSSLSTRLMVYALKMLRGLGIGKSLYDENNPRCILIDDYCQDKRFLDDNCFPAFREENLNEENCRLLEEIQQEDFPVSVHVRRGDYLNKENQLSFGSCPEEYYRKAVETVLGQQPRAVFYLFSDDKEWLKVGFPWLKARSVSCNQGRQNYNDLLLMSRCKGHIIANSTFSFWGARLNRNNRLTVYPARWYANPAWVAPDIFPAEWIKI